MKHISTALRLLLPLLICCYVSAQSLSDSDSDSLNSASSASASSDDILSSSSLDASVSALLGESSDDVYESDSESLSSSSLSSLSSSSESSESSQLLKETQEILNKQVTEARKCFSLLFNFTIPDFPYQINFPKSGRQTVPRFRFHCQSSNEPAESDVQFLSSYAIDGQYIPEWVAFRVNRAVGGNSFIPGNDFETCKKQAENNFFSVHLNDIVTPESDYLDQYNEQLLRTGADSRDGLMKGQLCLPTHYLTCKGKQSTFAMTNVVPVNRYMYKMNWARGDQGIREYVTKDIPLPPKGSEQQYLLQSKKFHPVYAVAGIYFSQPQQDSLEWSFHNHADAYDFSEKWQSKKAYIPNGLWQAVLDPSKLNDQKLQTSAAVAWYCENRPRGPWPEVQDGQTSEVTYANGPKLCRVLSLDDLEALVGVRPFPDLPKQVTSAQPVPQTWHLTSVF